MDVQNRVNQALGRMPTEVRTNGISVTKNTAGFIGAIGFYTEDDRYDSLFISNYLDLYVRDAFKRIPGVGNVVIFGERKFAMRLWLNPAQLAGRGITPGDVVAALREQNIQVAAGSIGDAPAADDQMYQISVRAAGRLTTAAEFEDIVVKAGRDGALVRVKDVGRVELGAETYASLLRFARQAGVRRRHPVAAVGERHRGVRAHRAGTRPAAGELPARAQGRRLRSTTSPSCANRSGRS